MKKLLSLLIIATTMSGLFFASCDIRSSHADSFVAGEVLKAPKGVVFLALTAESGGDTTGFGFNTENGDTSIQVSEESLAEVLAAIQTRVMAGYLDLSAAEVKDSVNHWHKKFITEKGVALMQQRIREHLAKNLELGQCYGLSVATPNQDVLDAKESVAQDITFLMDVSLSEESAQKLVKQFKAVNGFFHLDGEVVGFRIPTLTELKKNPAVVTTKFFNSAPESIFFEKVLRPKLEDTKNYSFNLMLQRIEDYTNGHTPKGSCPDCNGGERNPRPRVTYLPLGDY